MKLYLNVPNLATKIKKIMTQEGPFERKSQRFQINYCSQGPEERERDEAFDRSLHRHSHDVAKTLSVQQFIRVILSATWTTSLSVPPGIFLVTSICESAMDDK
ncbi:hypothetical protein J6590_064561 [Homalodisca vitripennis]|nr:hypothetical protein J6590_064561 [Homalodisca vitripennis]